MIEIYARDSNGIESVIATYKTYEEFFVSRRPREEDLKAFGYTTAARTSTISMYYTPAPGLLGTWNFTWNTYSRYCYLMYEYDKFITPDNLVGKYRDWLATIPPYHYRWTWRHNAYQCRSIKTFQETRMYYANDDEDAPKIRAKRSPRLLPNSWDTSSERAEKGWKSQSKRKHQWK